MRFINHPVIATIMTLIVAQQWLSVGTRIHQGSTGMFVFHLVLAAIATACAISYHQFRSRAAYYDGKVAGIGEALNPTYWRPRV